MTTQMIIHIEPDLKNKINRLAGIDGKNVSQLVHDLLVKYIMERDMSTHIDEIWNNIGDRMTQNSITYQDIDKAVNYVRQKSA